MFLELSKSDHAAGDHQFVSPASESWQPGTNNKAQAAARNAATAERIATFIAVAKEALQSPPPAPPATTSRGRAAVAGDGADVCAHHR